MVNRIPRKIFQPTQVEPDRVAGKSPIFEHRREADDVVWAGPLGRILKAVAHVVAEKPHGPLIYLGRLGIDIREKGPPKVYFLARPAIIC